jgi:hypothetical protein
VIVAHHGGELPALVSALAAGGGVLSVTLLIARERLARFVDRHLRR